MTGFTLKLIAIITMTIDHIGLALFPDIIIFRIIGRLSMPIFCFLCVEGYSHTSNKKRYLLQMLIFAFISEIPFDLFAYGGITGESQNIFFTLFLGLIAIHFYEKNKYRVTRYIFFLIPAFLGDFFCTDYGLVGVALVFAFHVLGKNKKNIFAIVFCFFAAETFPSAIYSLLYEQSMAQTLYMLLPMAGVFSAFLISLYNGERGQKLNKYIFYWFYPIHLLIIYSLQWLISNFAK